MGVQDLGLKDEDFWSLTFRELDALLERRRAIDEREEYLARVVECAVYNAREGVKKFLKPQDLMAKRVVAKKPTKQTGDKIGSGVLARMDGIATRMGINNDGEREARERIKAEVAKGEAE